MNIRNIIILIIAVIAIYFLFFRGESPQRYTPATSSNSNPVSRPKATGSGSSSGSKGGMSNPEPGVINPILPQRPR